MCLGRFVVGSRSQMWRLGPGIDFLGFDPAGLYFIGKMWIGVLRAPYKGQISPMTRSGPLYIPPGMPRGKCELFVWCREKM